MLIFSLGTSVTVSTDILVVNNSSKNLIIRVTRSEPYSGEYEYTEEFILLRKQSMGLKTHRTGNHYPTLDEYLTSIIIYNVDGELIKNFNKSDDSEKFKNLFSNLRNTGGRNQRHYIFEISDELLI